MRRKADAERQRVWTFEQPGAIRHAQFVYRQVWSSEEGSRPPIARFLGASEILIANLRHAIERL